VSTLTITVLGRPAPQGSKRAFAVRGKNGIPTGKIAVIESSHDRVKSWRQAVLDSALATHNGPPLTGPLAVSMIFRLPRPKGHYRTGRNSHLLRDTAPPYPTSAPDLSKLARATEDALSDVRIWGDDAQVIAYSYLAKIWESHTAGLPGATITIWQAGNSGA
jgi:Holliday junction resolvase RusA-like endonuclease